MRGISGQFGAYLSYGAGGLGVFKDNPMPDNRMATYNGGSALLVYTKLDSSKKAPSYIEGLVLHQVAAIMLRLS